MIAFRSWGRVLLAAVGVGLLAGAGQLGFAYGLGLVRFARSFDAAAVNQWPAQLAWVGWFAMVAAVAGAVVAERLARRRELPVSAANRIAMAVAAGIGAAAVAPLSMQPARAAQAVASVNPVLVAGTAAVGGAVVGTVAALAALNQRPFGWNIAAVTGGAWFLALISVMPSLVPDDSLPTVRLGVVDAFASGSGSGQRLAVVVMPLLALVAGAATAALARWRGQPVLAVAASGVVGPGMLAVAYLIAGPGSSADNYQTAPYWGALVAVGAGALGSVVAAVARKPSSARSAGTADGTGTADGNDAGTVVLEPTNILNPIRGGAGRDGTGRTSAGRPEDDDPRPAPAGGFSIDPMRNPPTTADFWPAGTATPEERQGPDDRWDAFAAANRPRVDDRESRRSDRGSATDDQLTPSASPRTPLPAAPQPTAPQPTAPPPTAPQPKAPQAKAPRPSGPRSTEPRPAPEPRGKSSSRVAPRRGRADQPQPVNKPPAARATPVNAPPAAPAGPVNPPPAAPPAPVNPPPAAPPGPVNPPPAAPPGPVNPPPAARRPAEAATPAEPPAPQAGRARRRAGQTGPADPRRTEPTEQNEQLAGAAPTGRRRAGARQTPPATPQPGGTTATSAGGAGSAGTGPTAGRDTVADSATGESAAANARIGRTEDPDGTAETGEAASAGSRPRRGLFRRNRPAADPTNGEPEDPKPTGSDDKRESRGRDKGDRGVPAREEEYVDWVSGLSEPAPRDGQTGTDKPRRSLRSSGRHHQE